MAHRRCFYRLTNLFFSILPEAYERNFKEEIWGCFKHIGIPLETVMNMPISDRKFYIMMHNRTESGGSTNSERSQEKPDLETEKINMLTKAREIQ